MTTLKSTYAYDFKQKTRNTQSTRKHYPLFLKARMASGYAQSCAALFRLSRELLKLGQSVHAVWYDLALLRCDIPSLTVFEIVLTASRIGGLR